MGRRHRSMLLVVGAAALLSSSPALAGDAPGLLFHVSADRSLTADRAAGEAVPNFASRAAIVPTGKAGGAIRWEDDGYVAWTAPGNIQARRGTLAFFWRSRYPVGEAPFVLFRVGFADHSSWDMAFLRIDWNGHGFDAFVTDTNLARERVSFRMAELPAPDAWHHIAFAWDETIGVRLYVDGKEVARKDGEAVLDSGLDQFGLAGRVIAPHQVQSRYSFMRGSDLDEIRIYDRMLPAADVAALAGGGSPSGAAPLDAAGERRAFLHRYGFDKGSPPALTAAGTRIRKIEFADARDLKQWMWKGVDGIPETTWPGVYNRSRLAGRNDYFTLPDWNTYVEGGKAYELTIPPGEAVNRVEIRGAAYGSLDYAADGTDYVTLAKRPHGVEKSIHSFAERTGGRLRFTNVAQETPIQEIWAYDVRPGEEPEGTRKLSYTVDSKAAPGFAALAGLNAFIAGRYPPAERATVVALPARRGGAAVGAGSATAAGETQHGSDAAPLVHILIPSGFSAAAPGRPLARAWNYTWANAHDGLDGIALDIPALKVTPNRDGLVPLNIRVKDPIWPERDMIDVSVSVRPGEARTLWLDLRDRILTEDSLYLTVASAAPDFGPASLDGMKIRLVFKDRRAAKAEHVADRFNQVRDNWGFLVEEHTASAREALYRRVKADITDLLRVDPDNLEGRRYWADISYGATGMPPFTQPAPPAGVPLWAFRQLEDLKLTRRFVDWWIDNRQVPYGDFGGGISDDTDLTQQWPGLALMGVEPDKINASLRALSEAAYANGMITGGLGTITTDELHAYEEGLNSDAERLYLNWGEPRAVERLMATTKALTGIILRNPAGHMHFASNWYGGTKVYRERPWEWQKPYSFTVMHAPILMGVYNGNPIARGLVTGVVDGWLAHGRRDAKGLWSYPNEIDWRTDAERVGDGGGVATPYQSVWAAWRFTGDDRYLTPILSRVAKGGPAVLGDLNENVIAALGRTGDWGKALAGQPGDFARVAGWDATGDRRLLEALHADAIEDKVQHEYMYTEGHWWSDRVDQPNELLQRERLGGIALKRNQTYPGNTVSWRFADPGAAEQVAILMPGATRERFKVIAYNMSDVAQPATMTAWNVAAGRWTMTAGTSAADGDTADGSPAPSEVTLERSASVAVSFAPRTTTVLEFALKTPGPPPEGRPDLGIGVDDVRRRGRTVSVTVHSLGAVEAAGGSAMLEDAAGKLVASVPLPTLAAPLDLTPKTATVRVAIPAGVAPASLRVRVALSGDTPEVTRLNNVVPLE
ncbi:LamG-like jellyroll fold domain-containing protein [Sphingomonas sp. DT-204]|uniref:LamG-like jellyroll fold domain-containing protein n=1 Tax=Sphingomonas sp. DT-204 TaxID=3396166 RepID=UPI003F1D4348